MRKNAMKQKITAMLCAAMLLGQTVPAALGEDLALLIMPDDAVIFQRLQENDVLEDAAQRKPEAELASSVQQEKPPQALVQPTQLQIVSPSVQMIVPVEPIIPSAPSVPEAPTEPTEPAAPTVPTKPAAPTEPTAPTVPTVPVYSKIDARVTTGKDSITVTIVEASEEAMYAAVGESLKQGLHKGDSAVFTGLTAGKYDIEVDYENGTNAFRTTATIEAQESVEPVIPPSGESGSGSGGSLVEPIIPPSADPVEPIVPPSADPVEPVIPPSSGTEETVKAFTVLPVVTDGAIAVVIDGASSREIEIELLDKDGKRVASSAIIGSGLVQLGKFSSGTYTVRAQYVTPVQNADGSYDHMTVTAQAVVPEGVTAPEQSGAVDIQAKVETGRDYIIITVTQAADREMIVSVEGQGDKRIFAGNSVRYDGLTPGESYAIEIDYVDYLEGAKKFSKTVTLEKPVVLGEIKITAVTPGINKLTVSGTATPGKQIILTTSPAAAADVYAMPGENGVFKAEIACAAGTYKRVTAKYSEDTSKSTEAEGKWIVEASTEKPQLTVDPIDTFSTTVIAKTNAGVIVEIRTGDYTQKVIADEHGIVRFSLPHTYKAGTRFTFVVYYADGMAFQQTVQVSAAQYLGTLEYGDEGDAVRKLTKRLKELGYLNESSSRYGSAVREAVRLFQITNGITADGIAGPKTQQALFSVGAIPYGSTKYPTLVRGDRGYALIYTLQQRLKDLGYYTIKVDGIFGSATQRAVREFQRVNGLSVTGKADNATQTLLYSSAAKPAHSGLTGSYTTLARSGKYRSAVVPLQKRLKALGYYSGNIDGYFGSATYRAVRNFQNRNGLPVTGVADPYTQQVLYSASARAYSGSTSSSSGSSGSSVGYRLLYWGCRGEAVVKLQKALINAGYKDIVRSADGIFGQWTYDAVRAYQRDHGLAVDGIAGRNTQNSLYGTHY